MSVNVSNVQLQIKAFNKALSRADKANLISDEVYAAISDLIDPERMTSGGYGKAGKKYLENMDPEELLSYSADIEQARELLDVETYSVNLDIQDSKDIKGLLWKMYQKIQDKGLGFDSDNVRAVELGATRVGWKKMVLQMNKYMNDPNMGLSDFTEWFNKQEAME